MMSFRIVVILFVGMIVGYAQSESDKLSELVEVPEVGGGVIRLPLRVHLIQDVELEQKRVAMSMWVTMREFEEVVLPEINRIWEAAKIEWIIESIVEQPGAEIENREAAIETIENAKRNAAGKSDPARVPHLKALCGKEKGHPVVNNLYLFPYMGQASQGIASMGGNWAIVGVWTDKPRRSSLEWHW
jgi:hypothetical protein